MVKDSPKRVLILLAGFILGFILSSIFIVLGNLFTKAK